MLVVAFRRVVALAAEGDSTNGDFIGVHSPHFKTHIPSFSRNRIFRSKEFD